MDLSRRTIVTGAVGAGTLTAAAVAGAASPAAAADPTYIEISHRPVNLADRLPPGATADTDATQILVSALAESPHVEWPHATALRLTSTVTIPTGAILSGYAGALARIDHARAGFEVAGSLRGVDISRVAATSSLDGVGAWIVPDSVGASVENVWISGDNAAGVAVGGSPDRGSRPGTAVDALVRGVRVERSQAASSFNFRLDDSQGAGLIDCVGLGAELDNIKVRVHARDFRVVGGRYTGSTNGDGIDAFCGGEGGFIGGGVIFEDNVRNGIVVKTDYPIGNAVSPADQAVSYGLPRQVIIDGVIVRRPGGSGISLHRSDAQDSDYAGTPSARLPWLADVTVSSAVIEDAAGSGLFINGFNFSVDNVQILRPRGHGVHIHANARHHRLARVAVRAACFGNPTGTNDGFRLDGKHLWLTQCAAQGIVGDFVDDADYATATKYSRYGFISAVGTGATHHFAQCMAYWHRVAPIAGEAIGYAKHTDGDYESYSSGWSLGGLWLRNNAGTLEKSAVGGTTGFTAV